MNKITEFFCRSAGFGWFCADKKDEPLQTKLIVIEKSEDASSYIPPRVSLIDRMIRGEMARLTLETVAPSLREEVQENGCISSQTRRELQYINRDVPPLLNEKLLCPIDLRNGEDVLPIKVDKF